jgi:hypothetical protein
VFFAFRDDIVPASADTVQMPFTADARGPINRETGIEHDACFPQQPFGLENIVRVFFIDIKPDRYRLVN